MEQVRNYVCTQCSTPVPSGHKFCGRCGGSVPAEVQTLRVDYYGAVQVPGRGRLILVRGNQGVEGLSYLLHGTEHAVGSEASIRFPEDNWLSPHHAQFIYRGDKLVVRDEGSQNGVYVRLRQPTTLEFGDMFVCGDHVFRVDGPPTDTAGPDDDKTYFYSSPKKPAAFRVAEILRGGVPGMSWFSREGVVTIGREDCDMNFGEDPYLSPVHAKLEATGGKVILSDSGSRNGTFVRVKGEVELAHGDYLFIGKQLLRVEMTS